jgi:plasmid stabilization system protein ParE
MSFGGPFEVRFTDTARDDLEQLFSLLLQRASSAEDLELAQRAIDAIQDAVKGHLASTPFSFRRTGSSPQRRELIIPFGSSGYIALYEIEPAKGRVVVLAVRHHLEDDYR